MTRSHLRSALALLVMILALLALVLALSGCATRAVNPPDHLSPEHIPEWANPKTEAEHMALMRAGDPEYQARLQEIEEALDDVQNLNAAMNREHEELGDDPAHGLAALGYGEPSGRPIDLIPHQVPNDWLAYEDRRIAFGSSQDWVPRAMLNDRTHVVPVPATGTESVVLMHGGVVLVGTGAVCVDRMAPDGDTHRACLPVEELRRLLHGRER